MNSESNTTAATTEAVKPEAKPHRPAKAIVADQKLLLKEAGGALLRALNPFSKSKRTWAKISVTSVYAAILIAIAAAAAFEYKVGRHVGADEAVTYWVTVANEEYADAAEAKFENRLDDAAEHRENMWEAWVNAWNHVEKPGAFRRAASAVFGR